MIKKFFANIYRTIRQTLSDEYTRREETRIEENVIFARKYEQLSRIYWQIKKTEGKNKAEKFWTDIR